MAVKEIHDVVINGENLGLGGYLDIGLIDTMKDLLVNFVGAVVFSVAGYFYARSKGKKRAAALNFVPSKKMRTTITFSRPVKTARISLKKEEIKKPGNTLDVSGRDCR